MATNFATANYQEIIDLHTEANTVSVIGIHSPNTIEPVNMLKGFWSQFKKFKYNGCSIQLVPAARLPADPLQVSYDAGETTIDPRDLLNPIMFHGCHGQDMGVVLNALLGGTSGGANITTESSSSVDFHTSASSSLALDSLYYRALTDTTWKKANPQVGFKKSGLRPMKYQVMSNTPYGSWPYIYTSEAYPDFRANAGVPVSSDSGEYEPTGYGEIDLGIGDDSGSITGKDATGTIGFSNLNQDLLLLNGLRRQSWPAGTTSLRTGQHSEIQFSTGKLVPFSWQDTHSVLTKGITGTSTDTSNVREFVIADMLRQAEQVNTVDKAYMGVIMLPPAYKTEQYYRLIINHSISFKNFRGISNEPPAGVTGPFDGTTYHDFN